MAETEILSADYPIDTVRELFTARVDKRWILFSDGYTGVYAWDSSTTPASMVIDYLPTQNDNSGVDTSNETASWCVSNTPVPGGHYLTYHKGRVFIVNPNLSRIYYSGTRTDLSVVIGGTSRTMKPWENWNLRMDLSRHNPAHGGSMVIGDPSQATLGIWPTDNGLLVFKSGSIYMWSWPESAAPHEVELGASLERIVDDVGLVSYRTIRQDGETIYFLGADRAGRYGVYKFDSGNLVLLSSKIDKDLKSMEKTDYSKHLPTAIIYDNIYKIAMQVEGVPALKFGYHTILDAWYRFSGIDVLSWVKHPSSSKILILHSDNHIYSYPNDGSYMDFGTTPIPWLLKTASVDEEDPISDKKFRIAYLNADVLSGGEVATYDSIVATMRVDYNGSYETQDITITGRDTGVMPLTGRAQEAEITVSGDASHGLRIRDILIGWRPRRQINA
jgi:hypothetical protein